MKEPSGFEFAFHEHSQTVTKAKKISRSGPIRRDG